MVFIEFVRDTELRQKIQEIVKIVSNVTTITEWKYNYYKGSDSLDLNEDNLANTVIDNPDEYVLKYSNNDETNESLQRVKTLAGL
jgi:hypothetical protein